MAELIRRDITLSSRYLENAREAVQTHFCTTLSFGDFTFTAFYR